MAAPEREHRPIAIGLARASSGHQEHSVGDQRVEIERWCHDQGHQLLCVFEDDGVSGSNLDRPGLTALLNYVEASKEQGVVVVWRRNRLARPDDPRDGIALERRIEVAGWRLVFLHGAQQSGNPLVDTFMATVEHHQSGEFLRSLATDITRGIAARFEEGNIVVGYAPYGYAREITWPNGTTQVIARTTRLRASDATRVRFVPGDPAEVEVVRRIFDRYAKDASGALALVAELNAQGVPSPRDGKRWCANTIRSMLKNPVYAGDLVWNRRTHGKFVKFANRKPTLKGKKKRRLDWNPKEEWILLRDHHEPLVSRTVWEAANRVIAARAKEQGARRGPSTYALTGLLHCANCGSHMTGWSQRSGEKRYSRYACQGATRQGICKNYTIHQEDLERAIFTKLRARFAPLVATSDLRGRIVALLRAKLGSPAGADDDRSRLTRELNQLQGRISKALDNMGEVGADVAKQLAGKVQTWTTRLREVELELAKLAERRQVDGDIQTAADGVLSLLRDLDDVAVERTPAQRRRLLQRVVERVDLRFDTVPPKRGTRPHYRFLGGQVLVAQDLADLCPPEVSSAEAAVLDGGATSGLCAAPTPLDWCALSATR